MVRVLADREWLEVVPDPAGGNRNRLKLTPAGQRLVESWGSELSRASRSCSKPRSVPYGTYLSDTDRLLDALDPPPSGAEVRERSLPGSSPGRA